MGYLAGNLYMPILERIFNFVKTLDRITFDELKSWAEKEGIGVLTLSIALNDLIEAGRLSAPEGFFELSDVVGNFSVPRSVSIVSDSSSVEAEDNASSMLHGASSNSATTINPSPSVTDDALEDRSDSWKNDADLVKAVDYLNKYHSVGVIRYLEDLRSLKISQPERILKQLVDFGFVEYSASGVVNVTDKLPKVKVKRLLSDML